MQVAHKILPKIHGRKSVVIHFSRVFFYSVLYFYSTFYAYFDSIPSILFKFKDNIYTFTCFYFVLFLSKNAGFFDIVDII